MKKQLIIIGIVAILVTAGLSGCNQLDNSYTTEKNKFIGIWTYLVPSGTGSNYSFTYYFFSNGTFIFNKPNLITNGTFDIIDGNLWLTTNTNGTKQYVECSYMFSENNTKLTIDRTPYTKQQKNIRA
jgi:uncharacterized membrane protein